MIPPAIGRRIGRGGGGHMTEAGKCTRGRVNFRSFYKNSYKGESRVRFGRLDSCVRFFGAPFTGVKQKNFMYTGGKSCLRKFTFGMWIERDASIPLPEGGTGGQREPPDEEEEEEGGNARCNLIRTICHRPPSLLSL